MARTVSTILSLQDQMSPKLQNVASETSNVSKQANKAKARLGNMAVSASDKIGALASKVTKAATAIGTMALTAAVKTGLSEAMDLEGYKAQLETATKDTQKAGEIMEWCMNLANSTPFEGGEVVEAASKFESMGMSAEKWVTYAGDMAGATNKSLDQATEALIDAQQGELERLKEFGIKKADVVAKANEMYSDAQVVNNNGQIVDQEKFNEAMLALMDDKFTGGMEKKAQTLSGIMSTISGIAKNGLSTIMGMSSDGTIADGSPLDILKEKALALSEKLQEMQSDGTFDKIAKKVSKGIKDIIAKVKQVYEFVKNNKDTIATVAKVVGVITGVVFAVGKVVKTVRQVKKAIKEVKQTWEDIKKVKSMLSGINPRILLIIAIIALVAAVIYLVYKNWDKVKAVIDTVKEKVMAFVNACKEKLLALKNKIVTGVENLKAKIVEKVNNVKQKISDFKTSIINTFKSIGTGIKNAMKSAFEWITDKIDAVKSAASWVTDKVSGAVSWVSDKVSGNANGTQYWTGGATQINEHGAEVIDLPSGSRIYPATKSANMGSGTNVNVNVTVQGNVIGNQEYTNALGQEVAQRLIYALGNT